MPSTHKHLARQRRPFFGLGIGLGKRGGVPTFAPSPSPDFWVRADASVFVSSGGAQSTDGGRVGSWLDRINGAEGVQATTANKGTLHTVRAGGRPAVAFLGSATQYLDFGKPAALEAIASATAYTFIWVLRTDVAGSFPMFWTKGSTGDSRFIFLSNTASSNNVYERFNQLSAPAVGAVPTVLGYTCDVTNTVEKLYMNGVQVATRTGALAAVETTLNWLLGKGSSGFPWTGDMSEILGFLQVLDSTAMASIQADYFNRFYTSPVLYHGNSLTFGTGASDQATTSYPAVANAALGLNAYQGINQGAAGQPWPALTSDGPANIDPARFGRGNVVLMAWEDTNDLYLNYNADAAAVDKCYTDSVAYCNARKAVGPIKICIGTVLPRDVPYTGQYGSFEADRESNANSINKRRRADFSVPTAYPRIFAASPGVTYADYM